MTAQTFAAALTGALLIALGVLTGAVAERIRGAKLARERAAIAGLLADLKATRKIAAREVGAVAKTSAGVADPLSGYPNAATMQMAADIEGVLVKAGYPKAQAVAATLACAGSERGTFDAWVRAAFRRSMKREATS